MKLDVLAVAAHPDDVELSCSGTLLKMKAAGKKTGILDLTRGEMGTRGTPELRLEEATKAGEILGLDVRENLGLRDGFIENTEAQQLEVIRILRKYQPEIVFANAPQDRHPDHGHASALLKDAVFKSGLKKIDTGQEAWRPKKIFYYIQDQLIMPSFVVDITPYFDQKIESMKAYHSQFHNPVSKEPETYISSAEFWTFIEARAREMGHFVGATFGEGFISDRPVKVEDPMELI